MNQTHTAHGKWEVDSGLVEHMDKPSNQELFAAILSSGILTPYLEQNPDLTELIKRPDNPEIHYFPNYAVAKDLLPALQQRLDRMTSKGIALNLNSIKQLVTFLEEYPESQIHDVTFNCSTRHYGVRCGEVDGELQAICVVTGTRIPKELLGKSIT